MAWASMDGDGAAATFKGFTMDKVSMAILAAITGTIVCVVIYTYIKDSNLLRKD